MSQGEGDGPDGGGSGRVVVHSQEVGGYEAEGVYRECMERGEESDRVEEKSDHVFLGKPAELKAIAVVGRPGRQGLAVGVSSSVPFVLDWNHQVLCSLQDEINCFRQAATSRQLHRCKFTRFLGLILILR